VDVLGVCTINVVVGGSIGCCESRGLDFFGERPSRLLD
jgi:homoserine acetyltransferase